MDNKKIFMKIHFYSYQYYQYYLSQIIPNKISTFQNLRYLNSYHKESLQLQQLSSPFFTMNLYDNLLNP